MRKRVKGLHVINPIPEDVFRKYNEWLEKNLKVRVYYVFEDYGKFHTSPANTEFKSISLGGIH